MSPETPTPYLAVGRRRRPLSPAGEVGADLGGGERRGDDSAEVPGRHVDVPWTLTVEVPTVPAFAASPSSASVSRG